ncbi:hypothetical protein ACVNPX_14005 [Staphylococcus aureus]
MFTLCGCAQLYCTWYACVCEYVYLCYFYLYDVYFIYYFIIMKMKHLINILQVIDHSMIYVAIFGTYTPILLTVVGGWIG